MYNHSTTFTGFSRLSFPPRLSVRTIRIWRPFVSSFVQRPRPPSSRTLSLSLSLSRRDFLLSTPLRRVASLLRPCHHDPSFYNLDAFFQRNVHVANLCTIRPRPLLRVFKLLFSFEGRLKEKLGLVPLQDVESNIDNNDLCQTEQAAVESFVSFFFRKPTLASYSVREFECANDGHTTFEERARRLNHEYYIVVVKNKKQNFLSSRTCSVRNF